MKFIRDRRKRRWRYRANRDIMLGMLTAVAPLQASKDDLG